MLLLLYCIEENFGEFTINTFGEIYFSKFVQLSKLSETFFINFCNVNKQNNQNYGEITITCMQKAHAIEKDLLNRYRFM